MFSSTFPLASRSTPPTIEVISTSKVWTPPNGVQIVKLTLVGGGQSSGTSAGGYASGGYGVATVIKFFKIAFGASYQIVIGAGGVGAAGGGTTSPNNGGTSSFTGGGDRKSTRLNSSHITISYAVF